MMENRCTRRNTAAVKVHCLVEECAQLQVTGGAAGNGSQDELPHVVPAVLILRDRHEQFRG